MSREPVAGTEPEGQRRQPGGRVPVQSVLQTKAENGEGEAAVRDYIERSSRKFNAQHALCRTRRQVNPVTEHELRSIVDIWTETAMSVTEPDLRKMERLAQAQQRRLRPAPALQLHAAE